jgi:hypothetical protein
MRAIASLGRRDTDSVCVRLPREDGLFKVELCAMLLSHVQMGLDALLREENPGSRVPHGGCLIVYGKDGKTLADLVG